MANWQTFNYSVQVEVRDYVQFVSGHAGVVTLLSRKLSQPILLCRGAVSVTIAPQNIILKRGAVTIQTDDTPVVLTGK